MEGVVVAGMSIEGWSPPVPVTVYPCSCAASRLETHSIQRVPALGPWPHSTSAPTMGPTGCCAAKVPQVLWELRAEHGKSSWIERRCFTRPKYVLLTVGWWGLQVVFRTLTTPMETPNDAPTQPPPQPPTLSSRPPGPPDRPETHPLWASCPPLN
jgi:hypothetical protein